MLQSLANELLLAIFDCLESEKDISALARANRGFYGLFNGRLYLRNAQKSCCSALKWAACAGRNATAEKAISAWATLVKQRPVEQPLSRYMFFGHDSFVKAAENGNSEIVLAMMDTEQLDVNWRDPKSGRTALGWAAMHGHAVVVRSLIKSEETLLDSADFHGHTPLSLAVQTGDLATVKLLLGSGKVNPNSTDNIKSRTPLSWAALYGRLDIMQKLLQHRDINLEAPDMQGWTVLMLACRDYCSDAAAMLLAAGPVNVNARDRFWNRTPLIWAAGLGNENVVRVLLESNDIVADATDLHGKSALAVAVQAGCGRVVKLLLDSGKVDLEAINFVYGKSPLRWGVSTHRSTVNFLPPAARPYYRSRRKGNLAAILL